MNRDQDVILAKIAIMKKCVATIEQVQREALDDWMRQDLSVLNLQRAIQAAIDLAHVVIASYGLGLPSDYGQAFDLLVQRKIIDPQTAVTMKKMVGFRNVSVHEYQEINKDILQGIIRDHLDDFESYYSQVHGFIFGSGEC